MSVIDFRNGVTNFYNFEANSEANHVLSGEISIDWTAFKKSLLNRYSHRYACSIFKLAKENLGMLNGNLSELETFSKAKRRMILASLIALSKHLGIYDAFKRKMHDFGIKWQSQNSIESFLRIINDKNHDVPDWIKTCLSLFDRSYAVFVEFAFISGLRKGEAIEAFNLALKLNAEGKLGEFYNEKLETLELYKFPKLFLRRSKNAFISFIPAAFMKELVKCKTVSNSGLKRRLRKHCLPCRLHEEHVFRIFDHF